MSSDEITFEGVTYVSSKRASDVSGYAQDYIGQLARSGQIQARRVEGLWYVYMDSLDGYKNQSNDPKNDSSGSLNQEESDLPVSFDGNDYISANRASKITGYNQDYIGQLARTGKVLSRQIGKRWYIDQSAIIAHKKEKDALLAAVQAESVGVSKPVTDEVVPQTIYKPEPQLLRYITEDRDLGPRISPIRREVIMEDKVSRNTELTNRETQAFESVEGNSYKQVPIHVIKKKGINSRNTYHGKARKTVKDRRYQNGRQRIPFWLGLLIFAGVAVISIAAILLLPASSGAKGAQFASINTNIKALITVSESGINQIGSAFESLIDPELVYQRSK